MMNRTFGLLLALILCHGVLLAASSGKRKVTRHSKKATVTAKRSKKRVASGRHRTTHRRRHRRVTRGPWKTPTFADSTIGDNVDGEDLEVRRAAVAALGRYNGSVVVVNPDNGRILTVVNQKEAFKSGFQPCSTIKLVTTLAAFSEGILDADTPYHITRRVKMDFTRALAHSNNGFFASLGTRMGFQAVHHYAQLLGLGEKAGLDIPGEEAGVLASTPPKNGGVGRMTSFGEGISLTPLELASLLTSISNGGTMYYLQYPRTQQEIDDFIPQVKRHLDIGPYLDDLKTAMRAVTDYGTGRRASYDPDEPILGKTGTCTDYGRAAHMGWFGSFNEVGQHKLVVVVMLTGARYVSGPLAAEIAGKVYKQLSQQDFFASASRESDLSLVSTQSCCAR